MVKTSHGSTVTVVTSLAVVDRRLGTFVRTGEIRQVRVGEYYLTRRGEVALATEPSTSGKEILRRITEKRGGLA